jgi:hypothetical protein
MAALDLDALFDRQKRRRLVISDARTPKPQLGNPNKQRGGDCLNPIYGKRALRPTPSTCEPDGERV